MEFECRICLTASINESRSLLDTCEVKDGLKTVKEMITFCSSIEILDSELLPQQVCARCLENLIVGCNIKTDCIESHFKLKERLNNRIETETDLPSTSFNDDREDSEIDEKSDSEILDEAKQRKTKRLWPQKCPDCSKILKSKKSKQSHSKNMFNQCMKGKAKDFNCYICSEKFHKLILKVKHLKIYHKNDDFVCQICKCVKKSATSLDSHIMYHFMEKNFCCEKCGKSFPTAIRLKTHLEGVHSVLGKFLCDLCGRRVKDKGSLKDHMNTKHLNRRQFTCKECGDAYSYTRKTVYMQHMYRFHNVEPLIRCLDCNAGFTHPHELKRHKNKLGNCKEIKTTEYVRFIGQGNKFCWKGPKTVNAGVFSDKKGEVFCKICNKRFTSTGNLIIHNQVKHEGLTYKCDLCSSEYVSPKGLYSHKQTKHLKFFPFQCEVCKKLFPQKTALERHRLIHTDLKPFNCNICKKAFNDCGSCRRHLRTVHKIVDDVNSLIVKS